MSDGGVVNLIMRQTSNAGGQTTGSRAGAASDISSLDGHWLEDLV